MWNSFQPAMSVRFSHKFASTGQTEFSQCINVVCVDKCGQLTDGDGCCFDGRRGPLKREWPLDSTRSAISFAVATCLAAIRRLFTSLVGSQLMKKRNTKQKSFGNDFVVLIYHYVLWLSTDICWLFSLEFKSMSCLKNVPAAAACYSSYWLLSIRPPKPSRIVDNILGLPANQIVDAFPTKICKSTFRIHTIETGQSDTNPFVIEMFQQSKCHSSHFLWLLHIFQPSLSRIWSPDSDSSKGARLS